MKQTSFSVPHARTILQQQRDHDQSNVEAARIILDDPSKHGGESAGPVIWARAVLKRAKEREDVSKCSVY